VYVNRYKNISGADICLAAAESGSQYDIVLYEVALLIAEPVKFQLKKSLLCADSVASARYDDCKSIGVSMMADFHRHASVAVSVAVAVSVPAVYAVAAGACARQ